MDIEVFIDFPQRFKIAYSILLKKHPKLVGIEIHTHTGNRPAFYRHGEIGTDNPPIVSINSDWRSVAEYGLSRIETMPVRNIIKEKLGVENCTPEILFLFVLLHEFGHAYYYFGMSIADKNKLDNEVNEQFFRRFNARNLAEYKRHNPNAMDEELIEFATAYRSKPQEQRADSLACEIFQKIAIEEPNLFPEIKKLVKDFD